MKILYPYFVILLFWTLFGWILLSIIMAIGFFFMYGISDLMIDKLKYGSAIALIPSLILAISFMLDYWEEMKNDKRNLD